MPKIKLTRSKLQYLRLEYKPLRIYKKYYSRVKYVKIEKQIKNMIIAISFSKERFSKLNVPLIGFRKS